MKCNWEYKQGYHGAFWVTECNNSHDGKHIKRQLVTGKRLCPFCKKELMIVDNRR